MDNEQEFVEVKGRIISMNRSARYVFMETASGERRGFILPSTVNRRQLLADKRPGDEITIPTLSESARRRIAADFGEPAE
jgi:hypothetical protein